MRAQDRWRGGLAIALAIVIFAIDQVSKMLVQQNLNPLTGGPGQVDVVGTFIRFSYVTNTGAAFGMLPDRTMFFAAIALLAVPAIIIAQRYMPINGWPAWVSIGLMLGGNVGNLLDRVRIGHVIDFIDVGIGNLRWYVFNVADATFFIGVSILAIYLLFFVENPRESKESNAT